MRPPLETAAKPGDRLRFTPRSTDGTRFWTLRARDDRYLVATRRPAFPWDTTDPEPQLIYTAVDLVGWTFRYNGCGEGPVRSSLNTSGGGPLEHGLTDEGCAEILEALVSGAWDLSRRRVLNVREIEVAR